MARALGAALAAAVLTGCAAPAAAPPPAAGLILLDLAHGEMRGSIALGEDPLAVALSPDGRTAYVSDNAPGAVDAVSLPDLHRRWSTHTGGRPGPLLVTPSTVYVSVFGTDEVVALEPTTGAIVSRRSTCHGPGQLAMAGGEVVVSCGWGPGFGLTVAGGAVWHAAYDSGTLLREPGGTAVPVPAHLHPFWLTVGPGDTVYVAAEGDDEDSDPGAVLAVGPDLKPVVVVTARDPDQVEAAAGRLFVAAHGDRQVTVVDPARRAVTARWARGSSPVALAADLPLQVLVVVTDARE